MNSAKPLAALLKEVRSCKVCEDYLPHKPNPVLRARETARLLIVGQAPGTKVHKTGVPWNDPSGDRLRSWMQVGRDAFYDETRIAIIPVGFCYPGKGSAGDLPPRPECAPLWHDKLLALLPNIRLTLLIGSYAQQFYLVDKKTSLTETVKCWKQYEPLFLPLPHPSPRNLNWLKKNPWFEQDVLPVLRERVAALL
jgi:uracil-DNA glycosylase